MFDTEARAVPDADPTVQWTRCLVDGMVSSARVIAMAEAMLVTQVVELARVRRAEVAHDAAIERAAGRRVVLDAEQVERVIADEVAVALTWSPRTSLTRIAAAQTLMDRAPVAFQALADGRLDAARAYRIADGLSVLSPATAALIEPDLVATAATQTPAQVAVAVRRAVISVDPAAADRAHAHARARRHARVQPEDDGMASIWLTGPAHHVSTAWQTMTAVARDRVAQNTTDRAAARRSGDDPPELLTLDQARADAGLALLSSPDGLPDTTGGETCHEGTRVEVHVVVPLADLTEPGHPPADLTGHGPIPAMLLTDILGSREPRGSDDQIRFTRWLTDPTGVTTHTSNRAYRPSPTLAATIRARDATCRFPGCRTAARHADIDHTVAYPAGRTEADNPIVA